MQERIAPVVSLIVPVYKVEAYLPKCIDSLIGQTYQNLQIILVDDGSPDNCGAICDQYAKMDARITVVHKENGGLSDARNAGLPFVTGEYIYFVDSDDAIKHDAIERALEIAREFDADVVVSTRNGANNTHKKTVMSGEEAFREMLLTYFWEAWGKLYKTSLVSERNFEKGKLYEDIAYTPYVLLKAKKVVLFDDGAYYYTVREDSIIGKSRVVISDDLVSHVENLLKYVKTEHPKLNRFLINWSIFFLIKKCMGISDYQLNRKFIEAAVRFFDKHLLRVLLINNYGIRTRLLVLKVYSSVKKFV